MSATVERLLKVAMATHLDDDDAANSALGFILAQAANASRTYGRTWRDDDSTKAALKLAIPPILDLLAPPKDEGAPYENPIFKSVDEHARQIFFWIVRRLRERGDDYNIDWPAGHPMRNFPRAAAALNLNFGKDDALKKGSK